MRTMGLRRGLAIFLAVLLVISLEGFILTSTIGNVDLQETVTRTVDNLLLSPDVPDEVKAELDREEIEQAINSGLSDTAIYNLINSMQGISRWLGIFSAILVVAILGLALGSSLLILGIVGLVVGAPFLLLGALYDMTGGILTGFIPPEIESFAKPEIDNLMIEMFGQLAAYLLTSIIIGGILILAWVGYKIVRKVHKGQNKSKEDKKKK